MGDRIRTSHAIFSGPNLHITGDWNVVSGPNCTVVGNYNIISGPNCAVIGHHNQISGPNCQATGHNNHQTNHAGSLTTTTTNVTYTTTTSSLIDNQALLTSQALLLSLGLLRNTQTINVISNGTTTFCVNDSGVMTLGPYTDQLVSMGTINYPLLPTLPLFVEGPTRADLLEDRLSEPGTKACIICMERASTCVAVPCMHLSYCSACAHELCYNGRKQKVRGEVQCPECRQDAQAFKRVFM